MRLLPVHDRNAQFLSDATRIWEQSVRATHHFLTDADIEKIKQFVPEALRSVPSFPNFSANIRNAPQLAD